MKVPRSLGYVQMIATCEIKLCDAFPYRASPETTSSKYSFRSFSRHHPGHFLPQQLVPSLDKLIRKTTNLAESQASLSTGRRTNARLRNVQKGTCPCLYTRALQLIKRLRRGGKIEEKVKTSRITKETTVRIYPPKANSLPPSRMD